MFLRAAAACLLTAGGVVAQTAGARAVVNKDATPVYAKMSAASDPVVALEKGARVTIGLVLFGDDVTWCAVSRPGETRRLGYVSCEFLEPDRAEDTPPAPAPAAPKPAVAEKPSRTPIRGKEPPKVREVTAAAAPALTPAAAAAAPAPPLAPAVPTAEVLRREAPKLEAPAPTAPPVASAVPTAEAVRREAPKVETPAPTAPPVTPTVPPTEVVRQEARKLEAPAPTAPPVAPAVPPAEVVRREAAKLEIPAPPAPPVMPAAPPTEAVKREPPKLPTPAPPVPPVTSAVPPTEAVMREALKLETPAPTAPPVTPAIPPAEVMKRETPKLETPAPTTPPVTPAVPPAEVVKREAPKLETLTPPAPLVVPAVPPAEVVSRDAAKLEAPPPPAVPPVEAVRREAPELEAPAEPLRVVAPAPAVAVSPLPLTPQLILDRCGAASQIAQFVRGANFLSYLDKNRLAAIDAAALRALVSKHFQVTAFHRSIAGRLEPLPPSARAWLESPLGRWMADLSKRASTAASRDELVAFAGGLKDAPPPQSRLVLVHRLFDAGRPLDMELDATMATVRAIAEGINPLLPDAQRFGRADLDRALASVRSTLVPVLKNARIVQLLFTYRSVDDGELEELVRFWESESGRWLTSAVEQGFAEAAGRIGERLRAEIPRRVGTP